MVFKFFNDIQSLLTLTGFTARGHLQPKFVNLLEIQSENVSEALSNLSVYFSKIIEFLFSSFIPRLALNNQLSLLFYRSKVKLS
jgi:hypothetical protein